MRPNARNTGRCPDDCHYECARCNELPQLPPAEPYRDGQTPDPATWGPIEPGEPHHSSSEEGPAWQS